MSAQINLYHPRFLKVHDWLNLGNLVLAVVLVAGAMMAWTLIARGEATQRQAEATAASAALDAAKAAVEAATLQATRSANPQLLAEVTDAQSALVHREEIARLLESGAVGNSDGFSEFLRGFARQAPAGLWLTGFSLGAGGSDMEIRGSTYDEKIVPDYIRRLGAEKTFQGRQFSALSLQREAPTSPDDGAATEIAVPPAPTSLARKASRQRPVNFVLTPTAAEANK